MRNRIIALALGLCLCAGPALAGQFSLVSGTGTNGAQANATFSSTSSLGLSPSSTIAAGNLTIMPMTNSTGGGTSGGFSCIDTKSNSWTSQGVIAETAAATQIMYSILTTPLTTGDTVTCTQSSGPAGIIGSLFAFSATTAITFENGASAGGGGVDVSTLTTGPTASGTCNGTTNCRLIICVGGWQDKGGSVSLDAGYTNIAAAASNSWGVIGYKNISSSTAGQSCTNTTTIAGRATGQILTFKTAASGSSTYGGLTTTGAGP